MPHWLPSTLLAARTGALSLVVLAGFLVPAYDEGGASSAVAGELPGRVQRLIERHDCSTTGFASLTPASALVRSADGRLRLVAYERGLFELARAGGVVAVCLDEPPSTRWEAQEAP